VVGIGNELRGDDGAGLLVARRVRTAAAQAGIEVREIGDEPTALTEACLGRGVVIVTETMRSGSVPGTIRRLDASSDPVPRGLTRRSSTHAIGLDETIELTRALGRLPARLLVYAVEGAQFDIGAELSPEVQAAIPELMQMVLAEATASAESRPS
jgi:hydrogenase maturation protease